MRSVLFLLACHLFAQTGLAQSSEFPSKFSELLKPGDFVGINRNSDTGLANVTVYPERIFMILKDAQGVEEEALEAKYPELAKLKEKYRTEREGSATAREDGMVPRYTDISVYSYGRVFYTQVTHVGDDFFIVKEPGSKKRGNAISLRFVQGIGWREDVPFTASVKLVPGE